MICCAPRFAAASIISPTPNVDARVGSRSSARNRRSPAVSLISITPSFSASLQAKRAWIALPNESCAGHSIQDGAERVGNNFRRSFAAIRHRHLIDLRIR